LTNEIGRRARVTSGGLESLYYAKELFSFKHFRTAFFIISHKLIRYFTPFLLIFIIIGTFLNIGNGHFFDIMLYLELTFLAIVLIGLLFDKLHIKLPFIQFPVYFMAMNYGLLKAIALFLNNKSDSKW
jgi:hypothetical protein